MNREIKFEDGHRMRAADWLREELQDLCRQLEHGCGNHGCRIKNPTGQGTNGGCTCSPRVIDRRLRRLGELLLAQLPV